MPKWDDEAIVVKVKNQGEKSLLLIALTKHHGKHLGWFNHRSKKTSMLQPGDLVKITWSARLSDQLGTFSVELYQATVGKIIEDELKLSMLSSFCSLLNFCIPERELCTIFYNISKNYLFNLLDETITQKQLIENYLIWETHILKEVGIFLNLKKCVVSGLDKDLKFVSPKSGNAVSENFAGKYESKLLKLPKLLGGKDVLKGNELDDLIGSFNLTYYFLKKFFNSIDYNYAQSPFAARERLIDNIKVKFV